MAQSKSSARWLQRQANDQYIKQAKQQGWRSRAAIKLQQIDTRCHLLHQNMQVLDLGAAPGSWSQYIISRIQTGKVFALDVLPMAEISGVHFLQGDIAEEGILKQIIDFFNGKKIDLVTSDVAPNIIGVSAVDMPRMLNLAELALEVATATLCKEGAFLVKVFQGQGFEEYMKQLKHCFVTTKTLKPAASRQASREVYILAKHLKYTG